MGKSADPANQGAILKTVLRTRLPFSDVVKAQPLSFVRRTSFPNDATTAAKSGFKKSRTSSRLHEPLLPCVQNEAEFACIAMCGKPRQFAVNIGGWFLASKSAQPFMFTVWRRVTTACWDKALRPHVDTFWGRY